MASVRTSESASSAGRPGRRGGFEERLDRHQSSTETYNEIRKESRSMRHHLWEKVGFQHKLSAPSPWSVITHQSSKVARYEAHLSRGLYKAMHELEALQARWTGRTAPLARLDVDRLAGS
jgi:hypothetical protein